MQEAVVQTDLFSKHLTEGRDLREIDRFTNDHVVPIFSQAQIHFASAPDVTYKFCAISAVIQTYVFTKRLDFSLF